MEASSSGQGKENPPAQGYAQEQSSTGGKKRPASPESSAPRKKTAHSGPADPELEESESKTTSAGKDVTGVAGAHTCKEHDEDTDLQQARQCFQKSYDAAQVPRERPRAKCKNLRGCEIGLAKHFLATLKLSGPDTWNLMQCQSAKSLSLYPSLKNVYPGRQANRLGCRMKDNKALYGDFLANGEKDYKNWIPKAIMPQSSPNGSFPGQDRGKLKQHFENQKYLQGWNSALDKLLDGFEWYQFADVWAKHRDTFEKAGHDENTCEQHLLMLRIPDFENV